MYFVRCDREKSYLHKKLQKYPSHVKIPTTDNNDAGASMHQTEQLKKKIHQLEEEVLHMHIIYNETTLQIKNTIRLTFL